MNQSDESGAVQTAKAEASTYAGGEERPLGSYLLVMLAYAAVVAGLGSLVWRLRRPLPERPGWSDVLLTTLATHKIARLLSKDPVTSPLRAPFSRFAGTSGPAELEEEVRDGGPRKAIGELVTCPFCVGQWVATGLIFGLVLAPRITRLVAAMFSALTGADFLQFAYARVQG